MVGGIESSLIFIGVYVYVRMSDQKLCLVTLLWNNQHLPLYHIDAPGIADLEVSSQSTAQPPLQTVDSHHGNNGDYIPLPQQNHQHRKAYSGEHQPSNASQPFVDPAILSFTRPPTQYETSEMRPEKEHPITKTQALPPSPVMIGDSEIPTLRRAVQSWPVAQNFANAHPVSAVPNPATAAGLVAPFDDLGINTGGNVPGTRGVAGIQEQNGQIPMARKEAAPLATPLKYTGKRSRRGGRGKSQKDAEIQAADDYPEPHITSVAPGSKGPVGKGWRQTAFVESAHTVPSNSAKPRSARPPKSRIGKKHKEYQNGWATEDATDIQELGDFDFQSNLSKFDKRRIFDEIRNDDLTPAEARLAHFNRRARPGTNGGKNLHYTENVLDPTPPTDLVWASDSVETDEDHISEEQFSNGRTSSRARSRTSLRPQSSRKSNTIQVPTASSAQFGILNRVQLGSGRTASPLPPQNGPLSASTLTGSSNSASGSLQIVATGKLCPCVSSLQMLEVEQLAVSEFGLTDDIISENAGRGIAEAAVTLATRLRNSSTILVFAGNHRTGARAVTAARHFRNRGYRVSLCILGNDGENELTDGFRKQIDIFKRSGGRVLRWEELSARLAAGDYIPELVVEALFGMHVAFDDLRTDDQATAFEIISWANRSNVNVLSVDIPSGVSATTGLYFTSPCFNCQFRKNRYSPFTTGETTVSQGSRLAIAPNYIICLGAPKAGLLQALISGEGSTWQMAVADVGISQAAWRKYGTRRRHGVEFGTKWVVPLRFHAGP